MTLSFRIIICIVLHTYLLGNVSGRLLNAREHSLGKWILEMTTTSSLPSSSSKDIALQLFGPDALERIISKNCLFGSKKIVCDLHLKSDGTFVIRPHDIVQKQQHTIPESKNDENNVSSSPGVTNEVGLDFGSLMETMGGDDDDAFQTKPIQTNGRWKVRQNPYCVTDRHFDEILFFAAPSSSPQSTHANDNSVYSRIDFRCKLWGRFGSHHTRGMFKPGRMTHGRITGTIRPNNAQKQQNPSKRDIIATFRAIPESQAKPR